MSYKNLVFKGGGAKVFYSVGALEALEERGILEGIERVAGVSSGAVLALLTCMDMGADEIKDFFLDVPLTEELEAGNLQAETERFFKSYGRYTGENLLEQIHNLLEEKSGNPDVTFKELHDLGFKDLYVFVSDITNKKLLQFSWENTPDHSVADAVKASSAYPFYFVPSYGANEEILVDGGLLDNYPLWLFDEARFLPDSTAGYNRETLGIHIGKCKEAHALWTNDDLLFMLQLFNDMDEETISAQVEGLDFSQVRTGAALEQDIVSYLISVFDTGKIAAPRYHHPNFAGEIEIDTDFLRSDGKKQSTFELDTNREMRLELMKHGQKSAHKFFDANCSSGNEECYPILPDMDFDYHTHHSGGDSLFLQN